MHLIHLYFEIAKSFFFDLALFIVFICWLTKKVWHEIDSVLRLFRHRSPKP
jgi:hypothetical protein